jgi:hypothetical protein
MELKEELKIAEDCAQNHRDKLNYVERKIDNLKAQIAEAEKPKHGDVRVFDRSQASPMIFMGDSWYNKNGLMSTWENCEKLPTKYNFFDDLKALQQPLEEFDVGRGSYKIKATWGSFGSIFLKQGGNQIAIEEIAINDTIRNLRRMQATQKKKAAGHNE